MKVYSITKHGQISYFGQFYKLFNRQLTSIDVTSVECYQCKNIVCGYFNKEHLHMAMWCGIDYLHSSSSLIRCQTSDNHELLHQYVSHSGLYVFWGHLSMPASKMDLTRYIEIFCVILISLCIILIRNTCKVISLVNLVMK